MSMIIYQSAMKISGLAFILVIVQHVTICNADAIHSSGSVPSHTSVAILDAGSTSTKVFLSAFDIECSKNNKMRLNAYQNEQLTKAKALSEFGDLLNLEGLDRTMDNIISSIKNKLIASNLAEQIPSTPIILRATAGLRALSDVSRTTILDKVKAKLQQSGFYILPNPVDMLSGNDEGTLAFLSVNVMKGFQAGKKTYAVMDMGGGSTQVVFQISAENPLFVTNTNIFDTQLPVYVHSYLGLGMSQAMFKMFNVPSDKKTEQMIGQVFESVCISAEFSDKTTFGSQTVNVKGTLIDNTQRFTQCRETAKKVVSEANVVNIRDGLLSQSKGLYLISGFYYVIRDLEDQLTNHIHENEEIHTTVGDWILLANNVCQKPSADTSTNKYLPYFCMMLSYQISLVVDGYGLKNEDKLIFTAKIKSFTVGWSLGIAFDAAYTATKLQVNPKFGTPTTSPRRCQAVSFK